MIRGTPVVDVPCGMCGEKVREWIQTGPDDDDLTAKPCEHELKAVYGAWVEMLKRKR